MFSFRHRDPHPAKPPPPPAAAGPAAVESLGVSRPRNPPPMPPPASSEPVPMAVDAAAAPWAPDGPVKPLDPKTRRNCASAQVCLGPVPRIGNGAPARPAHPHLRQPVPGAGPGRPGRIRRRLPGEEERHQGGLRPEEDEQEAPAEAGR
ncbi:MAG: hypothetical protein BJ554DRAFT_3011, partial [Olpidium bornovanus]